VGIGCPESDLVGLLGLGEDAGQCKSAHGDWMIGMESVERIVGGQKAVDLSLIDLAIAKS
jgi:hypothetical protein